MTTTISHSLTRRTALRGLLAAGSLPLFGIGCAGFGRSRAARLASGAPIRLAVIGCGSWGRTLLTRFGAIDRCELVAVSDPDPRAIADLYKSCQASWPAAKLVAARVFPDYRELFAAVGDQLDAVIVATPNHHHALPTLLAIRHGANVYVEKPMTHTLEEALRIEREARAAGVVLRVGNKGHAMSHRPLLAKYLKTGVVGVITDVYSFTDRPNTMFRRPPAAPVPEGMDWDLWCGGAPVSEPYAGVDGRVGLHPHDWHSWIDYGNGSIGNMGTHVLDAPFQAMEMVTPTKAVVRDVKWGCDGAWNARGAIDFTIPERPGWEEITLHWRDGVADGVDISSKYMTGWYNRVYRREHTNFPPELVELERAWGVKTPIPAFGTVFVGTQGMIYEEFHRTIRIYPEGGRTPDLPVPDKATLEREERRIVAEFLGAVRGRPGEVNTGLETAMPLIKTLMLANMTTLAGKGAYRFDGVKTDSAVANANAAVNYRKGWEIA